MKNLVRKFLNKKGYEIIKQQYIGDKYSNLSKNKNEYYCETPIGNFYLPLNFEKDAVTNTLVRGKYFEPEIIFESKKYIKNGDVVLDVGSNFGSMTLAFSNMVGENGIVYSIEAQKCVYDFLIKTIEANSLDNVIPINKAIHKEDGLNVYFPNIDFSEYSAFKDAPYSGNAIIGNNGIPVKTITIDSLKLDRVDFIKVDIQGADLFALQGAKETILKCKPTIIFEFEQPIQNEFGTSFNDYVEFVNSINYKFINVISQINYVISPAN